MSNDKPLSMTAPTRIGLLLLLLLLTALGAPLRAADEATAAGAAGEATSVNVVVSIKPLQLIARQIVAGVGQVKALVPASGSPHHYVMAPSDRLALESADLVVYVGAQLETELHEVLQNLEADTRILELTASAAISPRFLVTGIPDPHIWLDSDNGLAIAAEFRDTLGDLFPGIAAQLAANYRQLEMQLEATGGAWRARMNELPVFNYAVYHDAIGYFEDQVGRRNVLVLVDDPEIAPGIRHILNVRRAIAEKQPVCLFVDTTSRQPVIDTLFRNVTVRQVELDLMGEHLDPGDGYPQLLLNLAEDFAACLPGEMR